MGVLRTLVLLAIVFLEVGETAVAMAATGSFLQIDEVSTSIKPFCSPVFLPSPLHGCVGCMVLLPFISSQGGSTVTNSIINTGVFDPRREDEEDLTPSSVLGSSAVSLRRCHARRGHEAYGGSEFGEKLPKDGDDYDLAAD
ncbi:unnamed protein product [Miscanthus lutarioriparius]|uniref:Secreted protein n=1 Tax=Miscanthus lutarioriparius TaxID=422564 RepID=A0A811QKD0_9POAL|nr:unnamed protein product [Miscanthus lutarioriparius]